MSARRFGLAVTLLAAHPLIARGAAADCGAGAAPPTAGLSPCRAGKKANASLVPDVSVLKTPQAPAFTALGVTPSAIEQPGTPTGAAVDLVTGLARGVVKPGDNMAWQASPYWLMSHPELSARDVLQTPGLSFIRNFTVSLATAQATVQRTTAAGVIEYLPMNRIAMGARTTIVPGTPSVEAEVCQRVLDRFTLEGAVLFNKADVDFKKEWQQQNPQPVAPAEPASADDQTAYEAAITAWNDSLNAALKANNRQRKLAGFGQVQPFTDEARECLTVVKHRTGFMWDVAYAMTGDLPNNTTSPRSPGGAIGHTAWTTMALVFSRGRLSDAQRRTPYDLSVLALGRYHYDDVYGAYKNRGQVDYGLRVVLAFDRWGFSVEGLGRYDKDLPLLETLSCHCALRTGGAIDYRLHSGMWATLSGGADFKELDGTTPMRLLAHFQANFGLDRLVRTDTTTTATDDDAQEDQP